MFLQNRLMLSWLLLIQVMKCDIDSRPTVEPENVVFVQGRYPALNSHSERVECQIFIDLQSEFRYTMDEFT